MESAIDLAGKPPIRVGRKGAAYAIAYVYKGTAYDISYVYIGAAYAIAYVFQWSCVIEYRLDGLVSAKSDVYSYGITLLETFTRRKPNEFEGNHSLKQWVNYSLPDAVMDVVDANLVTPMGNHLQKELDVVASIMKLALDCCAESPAGRTNMKDVVGMLQKIKIQLLAR
ncbi:putative LRR receptor-like serine/threonine-protein kinase GSO2-like [Capsicum annuum]|nr:putative LRR receptor-like serine/threonine-protein kinase GSO2-like [Capsicum annuum]